MNLRKWKTKSLLQSSIDCALLAVEIYNKPRAPFRVESFITHMIMAWTRLFQAYFNQTIGEKYFYKKKGKYELIDKVDKEKKAWGLSTCIEKYGKLIDSVKANLDFFIRLRNKIEHIIIDKEEIGIMIFGECQSLLYNFENELIKLFGNEYALNENLAYSLQFSRLRTTKQLESSKKLLSSEYKDIISFIEKFRNNIKEDVFTSQEFSIKLIQIPKIVNSNRNDLAIEFVNRNSISEEDKEKYDKLTTIVKDKIIKTEAANVGRLKPGIVLEKIFKATGIRLTQHDHKILLAIFKIRPYKEYIKNIDPFDTNTKYCHYDEAHKDYLYQEDWVDFLIFNLSNSSIDKIFWKNKFNNRETVEVNNFELK